MLSIAVLLSFYNNGKFVTLEQGWATLFDSRATLVTNLVDAGQYKYNKDLFDMTFEKKCAFSSPFSQKKRL